METENASANANAAVCGIDTGKQIQMETEAQPRLCCFQLAIIAVHVQGMRAVDQVDECDRHGLEHIQDQDNLEIAEFASAR